MNKEFETELQDLFKKYNIWQFFITYSPMEDSFMSKKWSAIYCNTLYMSKNKKGIKFIEFCLKKLSKLWYNNNIMKTSKYSDKGESKKHEKSESKSYEKAEHKGSKAGKLPDRLHAKETRKKVMPKKK